MRLKMKNKILTFIIGVLIGAIIATAGYFIYEKSASKNIPNRDERHQMINGEMPPDGPNGERGNRQNMRDAENSNLTTNEV